MKQLTLIFLVILLNTNSYSQVKTSQDYGRKKVGLVLSGGGAKGVAHIGVIKVLEKAGIPIDYIAGTSMGAIAGGLYSIGYSAKDLENIIFKNNWIELLSDNLPRQDKLLSERELNDQYLFTVPFTKDNKIKLPFGIIQGQNIFNLLNELTIGFHDSTSFDTFPTPFACVAFDVVKGKEVIIRNGNLPLALRSSMSIPGVFTPVKRDGMLLIDGGVINNFPVDVVRAMGADIVIGVDLSSGMREEEEINSIVDILDQITSYMWRETYLKNKIDCDLYLHPGLKNYTAASFSDEAIRDLVHIGEEDALKNWDKIQILKSKIGISKDFNYSRKIKSQVSDSSLFKIGKIEIDGISIIDADFLLKKMEISEYSELNLIDLNKAIRTIRGVGIFSQVTYRVMEEAPYTLSIYATKKVTNTINLGLRFDTEEMIAALLNTTINTNGFIRATAQITSRLSKSPYIKLNASLGKIFLGQVGFSYMYRYNYFDAKNEENEFEEVKYSQNQMILSFSGLGLKNFKSSAGIEYEHFTGNVFTKPIHFFNYFLSTFYETLDNLYLPNSGCSFKAKYTIYTDNLTNYNGSNAFSSAKFNFLYAYPITKHLTLLPGVNGRFLFGNEIPFPYLNYIGGNIPGRYIDQQIPFSGVNQIISTGNIVMTGNLNLRLQIFKNNYITAKGNIGYDSGKISHIFSENKYWGAALSYTIDSFFGPIEMEFSSSSINKFGVYLNCGKYF